MQVLEINLSGQLIGDFCSPVCFLLQKCSWSLTSDLLCNLDYAYVHLNENISGIMLDVADSRKPQY